MGTKRPGKDEIFNAAAEIEDVRQREAYLAQACGGDNTLRQEVEGLLKHDDVDDSLLDFSAPGLGATLDQPLTEQPGMQIGPYKLLQQIGDGGMGVVYMAEQKEPVKRRVALKIIKPGMDTRQVIARFEAERQALAMMDHPNIAKVLDAGTTESGRPFFVMELVNGLPVTKYCDEQHLTPNERLELFVAICQAVQHAHQKGIIHRDLKPGNILVALYDGQAVPKIIDFGVAKATSQTLTEKTMYTQFGQVVGTLEYMSPEQAERNQLDIDTRCDLYSLGVVLYELLTGETPFDRKRLRSAAFDELLRIIREEEPSRPSTKVSSSQSLTLIAANRRVEPARLGRMIRGELDWIVMKALEKDRARRYETASKFAEDVQRFLNDETVSACPPSIAYRTRKFFVRNQRWFSIAAVVLVVATIAVLLAVGLVRSKRELDLVRRKSNAEKAVHETSQRIHNEIIPQIETLVEKEKYDEAFALVQQAQQALKNDPTIRQLAWRSSQTSSVVTDPPGASIYISKYGSSDESWQYVGRSPLIGFRHARGIFQCMAKKDGYSTAFRLAGHGEETIHIRMLESAKVPEGMVYVPGGIVRFQAHAWSSPPVEVGDFFIDCYEVTNRQFLSFVDAGGYRKPRYWKHEIIDADGQALSFEQAMAKFTDRTGQSAPLGWKNGAFPVGAGDLPVSGVSWYEAAAFAEFAGKQLPTVYHWTRACGRKYSRQIVNFSNVSIPELQTQESDDGHKPKVASVGRFRGMGPYGTYDMAGNVTEWCWNSTGGLTRFVLGGASSLPKYMFNHPDARLPDWRDSLVGFRCIRPIATDSGYSWRDVKPELRDFDSTQPAAIEEFQAYRQFYSYDKGPLDSSLDARDDASKHFIHELISFRSAYGPERVVLHLFLPKNGRAPFQTVVYFPGAQALFDGNARAMSGAGPAADEPFFGFLLRGGRAVAYPVYKGTFGDRDDGLSQSFNEGFSAYQATSRYRDHVIQWVKDLQRSVDYLESRPDIDSQTLAYLGVSWGAAMGPICLAVESRFRAGVLSTGGFYQSTPYPEVDQLNFAPYVGVPVLMINGRFDHMFPFKHSQLPLYRVLGASEHNKRHVVQDRHGHVISFGSLRREVPVWLDKHLGPVGVSGPRPTGRHPKGNSG